MRLPRELVVLLVLLLLAVAFVLGYVIHRRSVQRAAPPAPTQRLAPEPPATTPAKG